MISLSFTIDSCGIIFQPIQASRAETVLNTTLSEFENYHTQKNEDILRIMTDHLDGEIDLLEGVLARLRGAKEGLGALSIKKDSYGEFLDTPKIGTLEISDEENGNVNGEEEVRDRRPSIYERDLYNGVASKRSNRYEQKPIAMPSPGVFDSRGVGVGVGVGVVKEGVGAVKEGVSSILSIGVGWPGSPSRIISGSSRLAARPTSPISPGSVLGRPASPKSPTGSAAGGSMFSRFW